MRKFSSKSFSADSRRFVSVSSELRIKALVIYAVNLKDDAHIARLGQKGVRVNETVEVHLFVE